MLDVPAPGRGLRAACAIALVLLSLFCPVDCLASPPAGQGVSPPAAQVVGHMAASAVAPAASHAAATRVAILARGVNITGWFRFPSSRDPAALRSWLSDPAIQDLKDAGFTFVRLAIDPALVDGPVMRGIVYDQVRRLQSHGLAVVVSPHPVSWNLDVNAADRAHLETFWREFAPGMRALNPATTFPEVLNEPVFHGEPEAWGKLQHDLLLMIRASLPDHTVILTGQDWGSITGLLALTPEADRNVVYSFHFYDPAELTSLAAYRPDMDRDALARLPFPETDRSACESVSITARDQATRDLILFWCATGWDAAHVRATLESAVSWARRHDVVLLAGEFGASVMLNPNARFAWLRLVRQTCSENGIGWALWGYDDSMGFNVPRPPAYRPILDRPLLAALGLKSRQEKTPGR